MTMDAVSSQSSRSPVRSGTSESAAYQAYRRRRRLETWFVKGMQVGLVALLLLVWEVAPRMGWINPMLTSYPSAIFRTLAMIAADGTLALHTWTTLSEILVGFMCLRWK